MNLIKKYYHVLTGLVVFIFYLKTLAPSVTQIDCGELSAVQATLGIAHPTGYPLFSLIGYLFSLLPLPFSTIYQLNMLAALWCAIGVAIFSFTIKMILDNIDKFVKTEKKNLPEKKQKSKSVKGKQQDQKVRLQFSESTKLFACVFGGLLLAFSKTFWFQSTSVEVYSFHIFLLSLIIYFLLRAYIKSFEDDKLKNWLLFAVFLALGFTNHMTTLLILPGVAYLFFSRYGFNQSSFKKIGLMLLIFFPILILVYSYLPIRASQQPLINWGNPIDFERIIRHISGKQYQVWLFTSMDAAKKQLGYFIETLPGEFTFGLIVVLIGMIYSFQKTRKIFLFMFITFLFAVLYSINYDIVDIDSYFLLAYVMLAFFSSFALIYLFEYFSKNKINTSFISTILIVIVVLQIGFSFKEVDQSDTYVFEDYTKSLLNSVQKNSIVFSYQWDYFVSASYYFQLVENYRKDVTVIDKELLRRSWYYNQLENRDPEVLKNLKNDVNSFLEALKPFERSENFNSNLLESIYRKIMSDLIEQNADKRGYYIAPELVETEMRHGEFVLPQGYNLVPDLFLFKAVKGNEYVPASNADFDIRYKPSDNHYSNMIKNFVSSMLIRRALYEMQFGYKENAKKYLNKVRETFPDYVLPEQAKQILND
jgi:Protein O-mannosyl-transferase TMEM260-like